MEHITFEELPTAVSQLFDKLDNLERLLIEQGNQQSTEEPEQLLTVEQAAQFLNLTIPTIYSKVSRSELPVMKRSKRLYFSSTELMAYLKAGRKKSNTDITIEAENYLNGSK
jgi:excisionase family DNA binding protein